MILSALVASAAIFHQGAAAAPVSLARTFVKGEKLEYQVNSGLSTEYRVQPLETWIPQDQDINYKFTTQVLELKPDNIVELSYKRPTLVAVEGQTFTEAPKTHVEKLNWDLRLTFSPINEVLTVKDLTKKPATPKKGGGDLRIAPSAGSPAQIPLVGQFVGEVLRLSMFAGSFDSALDLAPRLPFEKVKVGDTWKRTVGYSPQKLKGKEGKSAVQRIDYTYTFKGLVPSKKGEVYRISAAVNLDTELNDFINQAYEVTSDDTGLKSLPLQFKATIDFDLDPVTKRTLQANAHSEGGFKIITTDSPNDPYEEMKFKGQTSMRLLSATVAPVVETTPASAKSGGHVKKHG